MMANEKGLVTHGETKEPPSKIFMKKLQVAQNLALQQKMEDKLLKSQEAQYGSNSVTQLKFSMRDLKQKNQQKDVLGIQTLGARNSVSLPAGTQSEAEKTKTGSTRNATTMQVRTSISDVFNRSHLQGFGGLKAKYLQKSHNAPEGEASFLTSFYRTQNLNWASKRASGPQEKNLLESTGFSPERASDLQTQRWDDKQHVRNYLRHDINVHKTLGAYRVALERKHPEPKPAPKEEVPVGKKADGKAAPKKDAKPAGKEKAEAAAAQEQLSDILSNLSEGNADDDAVILDEDEPNFTGVVTNMQGAPYPQKVQDYIRNKMIQVQKQSLYVNNLSASKTGFTSNELMKDFEFKKENLLELLKQHQKVVEYKAKTKGKFADHVAQGPGENYVRDISWLKKANPEAALAESNYLARDLQLMEKRRYQKVIQCIQLEEQYGMSGVTKIPDKYK